MNSTQQLENIDAQLAELEATRLRRVEQQLDPSDCALSNWADGITSSKLQLERELIEAGGVAAFLALTTLDGQPVKAKMIATKFRRECWALLDGAGRLTGQFLPICDAASEPGTAYVAKDAKIQKKGFRQIVVARPAVVKIVGTGRGLSGTAWPARIDPATGQGACAWLPSEGA